MKEEYKTVCDECFQGTWYETEQPCKRTYFQGCSHCGSHENKSKEIKCTGTLRVIDTSSLVDIFTPYYKSKERVEVTYQSGEKERFYVGKSTGWKPVYLAIKKRNSWGGIGVSRAENVKSIRGLGIYL